VRRGVLEAAAVRAAAARRRADETRAWAAKSTRRVDETPCTSTEAWRTRRVRSAARAPGRDSVFGACTRWR
jgi:hypothetical protein